jgi:cytochrome c oxidase assembly protein subunit 15
MSESLYNLAPWWRLMLTGVALAAMPLTWLLLKHRGLRALQALTGMTLFLTLDLVMFGAFTRLTDSGLGCPDWPGCYGFGSPLGAQLQIDAAQAALPSGPVTQAKAWVEMVHRYLAMAVGTLILIITAWHWRLHLSARRDGQAREAGSLRWWASLSLVQGIFGALTVTMKLFPAIVTLHLLGGMLLLALLSVQLGLMNSTAAGARWPAVRWRWGVGAALLLLGGQLALGAWVSTNYAVLACTEFPRCQGLWWPPMNFAEGMTVWRPLGTSPSGQSLDFSALVAIHYSHRLAAYGVFFALLLLAWRAHRHSALQRPARCLAGLCLLQLCTGLGNVLLGWPLLSAVLHTGGAAGLVMSCVWLWHAAAARSTEVLATRRIPV